MRIKPILLSAVGATCGLLLVGQMALAAPVASDQASLAAARTKTATLTPKPKTTAIPKPKTPPAPKAPTPVPAKPTSTGSKEVFTLQGHVAEVNGHNFKIDTSKYSGDNAIEISAGSSVEMYSGDPNLKTASINDIQVGDRVLVLLQDPLSPGSVNAAKAISILPKDAFSDVTIPPRNERFDSLTGKVGEVSATGFTFAGKSKATGGVVVTYDKAAKFVMPSRETVSNVKKGDHITVYGKAGAGRTFTAGIVMDETDAANSRVSGELAEVNGNDLIVFTKDGRSLTVDASKAIALLLHKPVKVSTLVAGWPITLDGSESGDQFSAQLVSETVLGRPANAPAPAATPKP